MATELSREDLRRLARIGAARRLEELRQEEASIRAAFPDLEEAPRARGTRGRRRGRPPGTAGAAASAEPARKTGAAQGNATQRRYKMSAAQKRAVSERMKKYWAARRKAEG